MLLLMVVCFAYTHSMQRKHCIKLITIYEMVPTDRRERREPANMTYYINYITTTGTVQAVTLFILCFFFIGIFLILAFNAICYRTRYGSSF